MKGELAMWVMNDGAKIMAISSLRVYGALLASWSSNSKYAFLGYRKTIPT
ncbi:8487_t:CDS:2, partial [Rhizophagus irregularis]